MVIRNSNYASSGCGFFFSFCRQPGHGGGRAVEEKERERNVKWRRKRERGILFFLGLEIGMECNK